MSALTLIRKKKLEAKEWLWCVVGEESILRERAASHLQALCRQRSPQLEETTLRGDNFSLAEFRNALKNLSLFAKDRLVVVRAFNALRADDQKEFAMLIKEQLDNTSIILLASELDGR